jgi:TRAP-type uncharacterized transport system substrate-binding protein
MIHHHKLNLARLYQQRWWLLYGPILAIAAAVIAWGVLIYKPLPSRTLIFAAGNPQGGYMKIARRYVSLLAQQGLQVQIVNTTGWTGILDKFAKPKEQDPVQAGFAQGMYAHRKLPDTRALAVIGREPLWLYARAGDAKKAADLQGKRIGLGPQGTSTREGTLRLLEAAGLSTWQNKLSEDSGVQAVSQLLEGKLDAVGFVLGEDSQPVQMANRSEGLVLLGVDALAELARLEPRLRPFVLPQGALELRSNLPPRDLLMVATQTHLIVREGVHPATQRLLLRVAKNVHEIPSFLQGHGEFPTVQGADYPLASEALTPLAAHPWLEKVLPYWWAQLADVLLSLVLPTLLTAVLLIAWISRLFNWRVNGKLQQIYGEVSFVQEEVNHASMQGPQPMSMVQDALARLDVLEQRAMKLALPQRFADRAYTLRQHLAVVRLHLLEMMKVMTHTPASS